MKFKDFPKEQNQPALWKDNKTNPLVSATQKNPKKERYSLGCPSVEDAIVNTKIILFL